jgi:signal transduction histidine kinase
VGQGHEQRKVVRALLAGSAAVLGMGVAAGVALGAPTGWLLGGVALLTAAPGAIWAFGFASQGGRDALGGLPLQLSVHRRGTDGRWRQLSCAGDAAAVARWPGPGAPDLSRPEGRPLAELLEQAAAKGAAAAEWRLDLPHGGWTWLRARADALADGAVRLHIQNIDAERGALARGRDAARLLSLGEMAGGIAHELKQPLTVISLDAENAERALARGDAAGAARRVERIADQAVRAGAVIEHLRRFARGPEAALPAAPVELATAVEGALALIGGALREASVEVTLDLGQPGLAVIGEVVAIEQVLINLLANARDVMEALPPGAARRVTIAAMQEHGPEGALVRVSVADTGGGIPPALLGRLFEPFVTTKAPERGTGLGLAICQTLAQGMGGRIEARNGPQGALFTLTLQAARVPAVA